MSNFGKTSFTYPQALAALGGFVAQQELSDVCLMEIEGGVIVTGSKIYNSGESSNRHTATHVLSNEDIQRLIQGSQNATPGT